MLKTPETLSLLILGYDTPFTISKPAITLPVELPATNTHGSTQLSAHKPHT